MTCPVVLSAQSQHKPWLQHHNKETGIMKATIAAVVSVTLFAATPRAEVSVKNEVKVTTDAAKASAIDSAPRGDIEAFNDGKLYYNAIPSTPAAGTAVKVIDSKDDTDFLIKAYRLQTKGIASEIAEYLTTAVAKEQGKVEVSVNTRTGEEILLVTAPVFQYPYLESVITSLDSDGVKYRKDGTKIGTYKPKNRLASELDRLTTEALASKFAITYADDTVNTIYYLDAPSYFDATINTFAAFDVPPEQVRIEAQIVEIEQGDDFNFGLALEAWKEALPESVDMQLDFAQSKGRADLNMSPDSWARYAAQSVLIQGMRPKAAANFINYLVRTGHAKLLSSPTVVAQNGRQATISSLDNVSFKAYSTPDAPLNKQASTGISLAITPTIGAETISLHIDASVNSLVGWGSGNDPIINTRATTAHVVLTDGELFTLSGLRKDTLAKSDERVPVLGSIPLVGYAFRHEIDVKKSSEIIVLLTPHKVTSSNGAEQRERELLQSVSDEKEQPARSGAEQFVDRVIFNKK